MSSKLKGLFCRLLYLREDNSSIPVATSHNLTTLVQNQDRLVKLLDASVDLVNAIFYTHRVEFELSIAAKTEGCVRIEIMSSWQPDKVL